MTRGAMSAASIRLVESRPDARWRGQMKTYAVSLKARDDEDAIARVEAAIRAYGSYTDFSALPEDRRRAPRG
jgi:hypothetical protein